MTMREGDQEYMPYIGRIHDSKYLLVIPGRPPVCFKCERAGHLRQHCPMYMPVRPQERNYASAVKSTAIPVVGKPASAVGKPGGTSAKETVGKSQGESGAVGKPKDITGAVGKPQNKSEADTSGAVGKPQGTSGAVGMPQEDVGNPPDDNQEDVINLGDDSLAQELLSQSQPVSRTWSEEMSEEDEFQEVTGKKRKIIPMTEPESPTAAEPSRADRR